MVLRQPRLCENSRDAIRPGSFGHVRSISYELLPSSAALLSLRAIAFEFSHSLGRSATVDRYKNLFGQQLMDERCPLRPTDAIVSPSAAGVEASCEGVDKTRRLSVSQVLRNAISRTALYSLRQAAAHVHCTRLLAVRNGEFEFLLDRCRLLIIKEKKPRMPGRGLEPPTKILANPIFSAV